MKLNVQIIADELNITHDKILTDNNHVLNLTGFELADFGSDSVLSENLLYIASAADFSVFSENLKEINILFAGSIDASTADELARRSCNVLVCEELTLKAAVNRVLNIFSKYTVWNEKILNACLNNKPICEINDIVAAGRILEQNSPGQLSLLRHINELLEYRTKSSSGNSFTSENSTFVFTQLIRGVYIDESLIVSQLKNRRWVIDDSYYVLYLMKNEEYAATGAGVVDLSKVVLNQYFPQGIILVFKQFISVILRTSDYPHIHVNKHPEFNKYMSDSNLICGVSQVFTDLKELHTYYKQSQIATNYCKGRSSGNNLYYFGDYYFDYLIEDLKPSVKWSVISDPRVVALKRHDEKNGTEFVRTLFHFLRSGSNLQETATSLYLHRNTLSNRLRQIKELAEINLETDNDIDQILISCMLMLRNVFE